VPWGTNLVLWVERRRDKDDPAKRFPEGADRWI